MKKTTSFIAVVALLLVGSASQLLAYPLAVSTKGKDYLLAAKDLQKWSIGAYYLFQERDLDEVKLQRSEIPGGTMDSSRWGIYAGYDMLSWIMGYLTYGKSDTSFSTAFENDGPSKSVFGGGLNFSLLDHDIMDAGNAIEDKIKINGILQYTQTEAEYGRFVPEDLKYGETFGALFLSIVNEVEGNKLYWPNAITVYVGPTYSDLRGDIEEETAIGVMAGLQVYYSEHVVFDVGGQRLDQYYGARAGINVRL